MQSGYAFHAFSSTSNASDGANADTILGHLLKKQGAFPTFQDDIIYVYIAPILDQGHHKAR